VGGILSRRKRFAAVFFAMVGLMVVLFLRLPSSFLPDEDQGILYTIIQAPVGATQERTMEVVKKVEQYYLHEETETVKDFFTVQGFSFGGTGQNNAMAFVSLRDWDERAAPELKVDAIAARAMAE